MAEYLASIFGTEKDRVNCPFYFKIGACRHGDGCTRKHNKPVFSETVLMTNMYAKPLPDPRTGLVPTEQEKQQHFDEFYEDVFMEASNFGTVRDMYVCGNDTDHLNGNVYVHFDNEDAALQCVTALRGRFYAGRPILAELSPVTDFREARCRQHESGICGRGGFCNFMHCLLPSRDLEIRLYKRNPRSPLARDSATGGGSGGGGGGGGGRCFECGREGHRARDCDRRRNPEGGDRGRDDRDYRSRDRDSGRDYRRDDRRDDRYDDRRRDDRYRRDDRDDRYRSSDRDRERDYRRDDRRDERRDDRYPPQQPQPQGPPSGAPAYPYPPNPDQQQPQQYGQPPQQYGYPPQQQPAQPPQAGQPSAEQYAYLANFLQQQGQQQQQPASGPTSNPAGQSV